MERKKLAIRFVKAAAPAAALGGALVILLGFAGEARAGYLAACGDVWVDAFASCEILPTETCTTECMPVAVETVCAARLETTCEGSCTATADTLCRTDCETTCEPVCTAALPEGPPNCMGMCVSGCSADCAAACGPGSPVHCRSSCEQCCASNCRDECTPEPAPACDTTCVSSCFGTCEGRAKMDCQITCQDSAFSSCETTVVNECTNECETTGGAIFCDGQFMAAADLQACADELNTAFGFGLDVEASLHAEATVDTNSGFHCALVRAGGGAGVPVGLIVLAGLCAWRATRRNRRD
jgi:hypothetical protein